MPLIEFDCPTWLNHLPVGCQSGRLVVGWGRAPRIYPDSSYEAWTAPRCHGCRLLDLGDLMVDFAILLQSSHQQEQMVVPLRRSSVGPVMKQHSWRFFFRNYMMHLRAVLFRLSHLHCIIRDISVRGCTRDVGLGTRCGGVSGISRALGMGQGGRTRPCL